MSALMRGVDEGISFMLVHPIAQIDAVVMLCTAC